MTAREERVALALQELDESIVNEIRHIAEWYEISADELVAALTEKDQP